MAKISNKKRYTPDKNITRDDFLIGTDADDLNKSKVFELGDIFDKFKEYLKKPTLQDVTNEGSKTTHTIEANGFIKSGGDGSSVLLDDGSTEFITDVGKKEFDELEDVPPSKSGHAGKVVAVSSDEQSLVYIPMSGGGGGSSTFDGLTDTPVNKTGQAGKIVAVASDNSSLEYIDKQFTNDQVNDLLDLIYVQLTSTISLSPTSGERGVAVPVNVTYNISSGYDVISAATITSPVGNVLADVNTGSKTKSGGSNSANKTYSTTLVYTRNGVAMPNDVKSATFTSHIPQWSGVSNITDFTTYGQISGSTLVKSLQSSASITRQSSPSNEYVWFISNKNSATIMDGNNFVQSVGAWGSTTSEFISKSLNLTLSDGTSTATVYLYRSYQPKTLSNFTYKIQ